MKDEYIILYGQKHSSEIYAIAKGVGEAKLFIIDCHEELGIDFNDITCYKVLEKEFNTKTKVSFK